MTKLIRCDVCEKETDVRETGPYVTVSIPSEMLEGPPGLTQEFDVCSLQCVSFIGRHAEAQGSEPEPEPPAPDYEMVNVDATPNPRKIRVLDDEPRHVTPEPYATQPSPMPQVRRKT